MFKFLRKYNKWILAVGGTLLMIVFLVPQAVTGLSSGAGTMKATLATVGPDGSEEVKFEEFSRIQRQVEVMRDVGLGVQPLGAVQDPWHWYLLTREAKAQGLIGGRLTQQDAETLRQLNYRRSGDLEDAVVHVNGVSRMLSLYQTTGQFSDRRLRAAADRLFHRVRIRPVVVTASADAVDDEPTDAELQAQLDEWADVDPTEADAQFGYLLPDRAKIEWLEIDIQSVRSMLEGSDELSGTALRKHWRLVADDPQFPPIPDPPPATVPDVVRDDLVQRLAEEKAQTIARFATNELRSQTRGVPREEGYIKLPADWSSQRLSLTDLAEAIQERFGIELPSYHSSNEWRSSEELYELPGIGTASTDAYPPARRGLGELVMAAKEFGGSNVMLLQEGVAGPVLRGDDGSLYVFRITDTEVSRPPTSIDEVRDELVADLRRMRHYEQLKAAMPRMESQAERRGLLSVALEHDTAVQREQLVSLYDMNQLSLQLMSRQPLVPQPTSLPVIGPNAEAVARIIEYARTLPTDVDVDALSTEQRFAAVEADADLAVIVFELTEQIPLNTGTFQQMVNRGQIQTVLINQELDPVETLTQAFSMEALAARHNLTILRQNEEDDELDPLDDEPTESVANASR